MRKLAAACAICALASSLVGARGKATSYVLADIVVFRDAPGDGVHSEGPGLTSTYTNAVGGAVIRIVYAASGDINFGVYGATTSDLYSTQVLVTRSSKTFWTATTDGTDAKSLYSTTGKARAGGGNTAEYALPFQLTTSCSKCDALN